MADSVFFNLTIIVVLSAFYLDTTDAQMGACYGFLGSNLPPPEEVIALCKQHNIQRVRIYNPNPQVLQALGGSNVSVIVGLANEDIIGIANDPDLAKSWVQNNVLKYPTVNFRYIAVGNEIGQDGEGSSIAPSLAPAMQNVYNALTAAGLGQKVKVSTALSMGVLGASYPPSQGIFKAPSFINPIVSFLSKTQSPFLVNVYPYFAYISDPSDIRLDYAVFTSPAAVVNDGPYQYQNLFSAMVDAVHAALEHAGAPNVEVVVSETGWPSAGGTATTIDNAKSYNSNLLEMVKNGTPRKPGKPLETYIFDLIDENQKEPETEKHWGIFRPNKQPKYPLSFD
ncbi:glucan endo-1,3-beta-glucosidase, basic isoform-like [Primulina huaijiensis]|uniref:glucan endo-1,3-beta-glucosidase, basic isoform-like n=1 Tax=Primulina huaijiensis TaxID=1492673 RepID=UPI003CC760F3